jgi:hypothetical protein
MKYDDVRLLGRCAFLVATEQWGRRQRDERIDLQKAGARKGFSTLPLSHS